LYALRLQAPVQGRVRSVDWRRESEEWKGVNARPGGEVVMAQSWAPVVEADQARAHVAFCAALKADQPAERLLGSKRPCRIAPELSVGSDVETAGREPERRPSPPSPSSSPSSSLLSLEHESASAAAACWLRACVFIGLHGLSSSPWCKTFGFFCTYDALHSGCCSAWWSTLSSFWHWPAVAVGVSGLLVLLPEPEPNLCGQAQPSNE
jgi:hypothetical protein